MKRKTFVVHGRLGVAEIKLHAARTQTHGVQAMTFEAVAARLAGGFLRPIDGNALRIAIQAALPSVDMGELEAIKTLPGIVGALGDTLRKCWRAGIDPRERSGDHPRFAAIARLETVVLASLPAGMSRPADLAHAALARLKHAPAVLGDVDIVGVTELSPCWRPLILELGTVVSVRWCAGPRSVPAWLEGTSVEIVRADPSEPTVATVSAATGYHEAIEALRWARNLVASGAARPHEIAIAAASTADYDDDLLSLRADANLDLAFVHGVPVVSEREGQTAAALADVLVRGISQTRLRRLVALLGPQPGPIGDLPAGWMRMLPSDAPLTSAKAWERLFAGLGAEDWPDGVDHTASLRAIVGSLTAGTGQAEATGEYFLSGRSRTIWRTALTMGSHAAIEATLAKLRQDDGLEACASVAWMPAATLAASPRKFVRLLGLTSSRWPRAVSEDRLLSDHIIATRELEPLPLSEADRRDFATILRTTAAQVVLSRPRRDGDGRLLGRSPLLYGQPGETYLRRNRTPAHAFSETDRIAARPGEFAALAQAKAADTCWTNWASADVTRHDGAVRSDHPVVLAVLARLQSATSLRMLLRNPLGFVWKYGLGFSAPSTPAEGFGLDALAYGALVHEILDEALQAIEAGVGFETCAKDGIESAVQDASALVAARWESEHSLPPLVLWRRTLAEASALARDALLFESEALVGQRSYTEVPFGGDKRPVDAVRPWDPQAEVTIPGTGFRVSGFIDRIDISGDGAAVRLRDYKTGKAPKPDIVLDGGKELQRSIYSYAVRSLMGADVQIDASLLYPADGLALRHADADVVLADLTTYLMAASTSLRSGNALPGPDTGGDWDEMAFALPANAQNIYSKRKQAAALAAFGDAALVWEAL